MASGAAAQKKDATGTTERYYEMDISAHGPRLAESDNTGQVPLQMKRSLSWDKDWNILYITSQDRRIILQLWTGKDTCSCERLANFWKEVHPIWETLFMKSLKLVILNTQMFLCLCDLGTSKQWLWLILWSRITWGDITRTESQNAFSQVKQVIFFTGTSGLLLVNALK